MAYTGLTTAEVTAGAAWTDVICQKLKDDLDYLYGLVGTLSSIGVANGSFEIDSDADGTPDNWTKALYAGGAFVLSTTAPDHGTTHAKFTHPGGAANGGGSLTSDYIECSELVWYAVRFIHWASNAAMKNKVQVEYFTKAKVSVSTVDLYNSVANPVVPTDFARFFLPPATARYMKVILVGGFTDVDEAGSAYFDNVTLERCPTTKTWAQIVGTGTPAVTAGYNVASITDNGTGDYTLNFTTNLPDANYAAFVDCPRYGAADAGSVLGITFGTPDVKTASALQIHFSEGADTDTDVAQAYILIIR